MKGNFYLQSGTVLTVLVGQRGTSTQYFYSHGGGGGTFVVDGEEPLVIAGGGGGGYKHYMGGNKYGGPGRVEESGGPNGNGGQDGNGGYTDSYPYGPYSGGGGGFYSDGQNGVWGNEGGKAFLNGGSGGDTRNDGGFGGGAGTSNNGYNLGGGGGGYSGGNGGALDHYASGGGGSINSGVDQDNSGGVNYGQGKVIITFLSLSPEESIKAISDSIATLGLQAGIENSLNSKLDASLQSLEKGNVNAATNQLNAFINQVYALAGKSITETDAALLISSTKSVIEMLLE